MSMQLADMLYRIYFMEGNMKLLVDYSENWPSVSFPGFVLPELPQIFVLSKKLGISSPVPKLPFINTEKAGSKLNFGWEGSIGFTEGLTLRRKVCSTQPSTVPPDAMNQVMCEIEEAMSSSNTLEGTTAKIENKCISVHSGESDCACSSTAPIILTSGALTSPIPPRKNPSLGSKIRNKDHSNKGSIASHKINHKKLQLSVKVVNNLFFLFFYIYRSFFVFLLSTILCTFFCLQGIINEYPTGEQFLNQHGNIGLFAEGFTALERKFLKFLIMQMTGEIKDIQNTDMKKISKKDLHKVCQTSIFFLPLSSHHTDIISFVSRFLHHSLRCGL